MGIIFRASCAACGFESPFVSDGWLAVRLDSGELEVLPHPAEAERLKSLGYTLEEAEKQGRLEHYLEVLCDNCGIVSDIRSDNASLDTLMARPFLERVADRLSCAGLIAVASLGAALALTHPISWRWRIAVMPGYALIAVITFGWLAFIPERILHRSVSERRRESTILCEVCREGTCYPVGLLLGVELPCPNCSERRLSYSMVGKS